MRMTSYRPATLPTVEFVEIVALDGIHPPRLEDYMKFAVNAPCVRLDGSEAQRIAKLWRDFRLDSKRAAISRHMAFAFRWAM